MKVVKWWVYTVVIGLLPALMRFAVWGLTDFGVQMVSVSDVIAFGLVLHISMINEAEDVDWLPQKWRTINHGASLIAIAVYCAFFAVSVIGEKSPSVSQSNLLYCSLALAGISLMLSSVVLHALTSSSKQAAS
ncbi:hypothetical protein J2W28_000064 [Variovorax boronicumulans]|uniref:hypothetical protein n=1 Tax=Variovorax boronicumulans TaxID=436515 RepID=UPI00278B66EA|nr:hypothetical protein [Variovorax boronicumulans]MDP9990553.1 hypothetical protein [Variovorax boronicumulans]MDQ0000936.1 hypothetical protein [Variovorax boronicumulans]